MQFFFFPLSFFFFFFLCFFFFNPRTEKSAEKFSKERENIAREVVKTERVYATILSHIVNIFLNPLKESNLIKDGVITEENRRKIFPGALATLAQVHKDFLDGLEKRVSSWTPSSKIGDSFLTMIPYFKLYPVYVSDFESQMKALKEAKNNERFWEFVKGGFALLKDPSNDLPSLLITPVQRIPRYLMLVNQLLKYTWPSHWDYANIKSAAMQLGKIAEYVDQKAKDAENVQKMHHVQEILLGKYETLLDPQRRFVNQGVVFEVRGKEVRMMGLFHFSDMVVWAKVKKIEKKVEPKKGDKAKKKPDVVTELEYHYQSRVPLMNCSLSGADDLSKTIRNCFYLRTPEKNYLIACESPEAKRQWMLELNESIQDVNVKAATLRKQVAMVEEKKATMRQVRLSEEEKRKPDPAAASVSSRPSSTSVQSGVGAATSTAAASASAATAGTTQASGKDGGSGKESVSKPKRSGWLLKRKEEKAAASSSSTSTSAPAMTSSNAEDTTVSTEDTQSEEDVDADGKKKRKGPVGLFRGATGRAVTSKAPAAATETVVLSKKAEGGSAAASTSGGGGFAGASAGPAIVASSGSAVPEEKRKRGGGVWLSRGSKPGASRDKPDRRASESQVEDAAEMTLNHSPGVSVTGETLSNKGRLLAVVEEEDSSNRIRRGSRILKLDDLPTMDAKSGAAQLAELKAAFDGLEGAAGDLPTTRRRSLSAPDLLVRSPIKSPGPSFVDSGEDDSESDSKTPMKKMALKANPSAEALAAGQTQQAPQSSSDAAYAEMEAKRWKKLKALKRNSMSGMDITKHVAARRESQSQQQQLQQLQDKLKSPSTGGGAPPVASAPQSSDGSTTPPRPGRKAPSLSSESGRVGSGEDVVGAGVASKTVVGNVQKSETTRRASVVVVENSDEEEESPMAGLLKLGNNIKLEGSYGGDVEGSRSPAENADDLSSSSDLDEDPVEEQVASGSMSTTVLSPTTSGTSTPLMLKTVASAEEVVVSSSGEVTPKAVLELSLPPPPEKVLSVSPVAVSPLAENNGSFSVAQVPDCVLDEDDSSGHVLDGVVLTTPMMRTLTSVQNVSTSTEQIDDESGDLSDSEEADFAD